MQNFALSKLKKLIVLSRFVLCDKYVIFSGLPSDKLLIIWDSASFDEDWHNRYCP